MRNSLEIFKSQYEIVLQNSRSWNIQVRFQSNLKVECTESGHFIGEIAISHSRARNSINGTILRAKTGDDIVRISVMMLNNNILGPKRHLKDENCTREMRVGSRDFFWWRDRATFGEANRRIGLSWVRFKRLIWLHIFFGTSWWNPPRTVKTVFYQRKKSCTLRARFSFLFMFFESHHRHLRFLRPNVTFFFIFLKCR